MYILARKRNYSENFRIFIILNNNLSSIVRFTYLRLCIYGNIEQLARQILDAVDFYIVNEKNTNIAYPTPWLGKNSNSWARSIMNLVQANLAKDASDFDGADAGNDVNIPAMYFKGICSPCKIQNPVHR